MNLNKYLNTGHERTVIVKKNIFYSFLIKGLNVLVNLLLVPLSLDYLDANTYGVWLTLSSIVMWFGFFDIGLGNGLRNKLAEAFALNDIYKANIYTSTSYAIIGIISIASFLLFLIINPILDWFKILNAPDVPDLKPLVVIVFLFFFLRLVLQLINSVLRADQKSALTDTLLLLSNLISLACIYILNQTESSSILNLGLAISLPAVSVFLASNFILFSGKYQNIKPSIKNINWKYSSELFTLGFKFFIIQIAALILFTTSNIIITQLYNPEEVTIYNISFKYFSIVTMLFNILMTPMWSAYTEAFVKNDFKWINRMTKKFLTFWMLSVFITALMIIIANSFYAIWIGNELKIPFILTLLMGLYVIITNWNLVFVSFLNGTGKIKLQLYFSIVILIVNIPLSIYFAKSINLKSAGVILAICICQLMGAIWAPIQFYKVINGKANGIWAQ